MYKCYSTGQWHPISLDDEAVARCSSDDVTSRTKRGAAKNFDGQTEAKRQEKSPSCLSQQPLSKGDVLQAEG